MKVPTFILLIFLAGCASSRPVPPLLRPLNLDSLERVAQLPAYLVPPPAQASAKQVVAWRESQVKLLGNIGAPARKVKLKNVGNTDATTTVQQGITGRQLSIGFVILCVLALLLRLGTQALKGNR